MRSIRVQVWTVVFLIVAGLSAWLVRRNMALPAVFEDEVKRALPIGSSHQMVSTFIRRHSLDVAGFDYPGGDPRQGTVVISLLRPSLAPPVHVVFHFDTGGPAGKLKKVEVSRDPIDVPPP